MSATSSVERQNSANGEDMSHSHCQDADACPLVRVNGEVNQLDERGIDRTRHWVVSQGVVLEEVVKVNKTDCTVDIDIEQEKSIDITLIEEGCDVVFRTEVNKTDHAVRKVSTNIVPWEECCDVCIKTEDDEADGTEETDTIQEGSKYGVPKEESCVVQSSLQCHKISHSGVKPFTCTICNTSFTHKTGLMSHERFHSREKSARRAQSNNLRYHVKQHTCAVCNKSFVNKSSLRIHELSHATKNPFSCANCGKSYADFSSFQYHKLSHAVAKPYTCTICNKSFATKQGLKYHELRHAGENPFPCVECNASFVRKCDLIKHEKIHKKSY